MTTDSGRRLAAIVPTVSDFLADSAAIHAQEDQPQTHVGVVIVVDGLGWMNLNERLAHTPAIRRLTRERIETVAPSTTGAALTTITTGALPGEHGLIGYRILNPDTGSLTTTLSDWDEIIDVRGWQRAETEFTRARAKGVHTVAIARPAHQHSGLTRAILTGAEYLPAQTIADRFERAKDVVQAAYSNGEPTLVYLYIDELDRAGHAKGWQGELWARRLEQFDEALAEFLKRTRDNTGIVITADHGMIDIDVSEQILLDNILPSSGVQAIGGEPRCRYIFLEDSGSASDVVARLRKHESARAWIGTRKEWIESGLFGPVAPEVAARLGDVVIAAKTHVTYYSSHDDPQSMNMIGQHGSFDRDERGVPLIVAGTFDSSEFRERLNERAERS
ncbi:MAG: alkaline phosphatase family protein [Canibacter sp.]